MPFPEKFLHNKRDTMKKHSILKPKYVKAITINFAP